VVEWRITGDQLGPGEAGAGKHGGAGVKETRRSGFSGYTSEEGCCKVKDMGENRRSALVSRWKCKGYAAWLGVCPGQACETWSAGS